MVARSKAYESRTARFLGLQVRIPPGAWIFLYCECCVVRLRSTRPTDHSSRGTLPTVLCLSVIKEPHREGLGQ
jgi:hypothetical protein